MVKTVLERFSVMRLAKAASYNSDHHYKIGCVLVVHGKPVSVGFNLCKSHPVYTSRRNPSMHAEVRALLASNCSVAGGTAFIYREDATGNPRLARPCNLCYNQLKAAGIKRIIYTTAEYPYYAKEKI